MSGVQITFEPSGCNCDGTSYSKQAINAACAEALQLARQKKTLGRDKYPHAYNDYEHFSFSHAHKPYLEFPIMQNGVYDGESPGADRIVIGSISEDFQNAVFCAVITHDGQRKNGFAECADDTMNVNGKGEYEGHGDDEHSEGHQHKRHHHNKKLLDRIDMPN